MSENPPPSARDGESYEEYARKMDLFMEGPTTTNFERLTAAGIQLPPPDSIAAKDIRTKLWEVVAALAERRTHLDLTDHLSDSELYTRLWNDMLREEVPATDPIGFSSHVDLVNCKEDEEAQIYLKYYADEKEREAWLKDFPHCVMPPQEEAPFHRDWILPRPNHEIGPDAREWLRANPSQHAFATNRFSTTQDALAFVEGLHAAGATAVTIDNIMFLPGDNWLPYADTLIVKPSDGVARHALVEFIEQDGRPDEDGGEVFADRGQSFFRLWWD